MKYLIMKCRELGDQWECDCDRTPIIMVNDYKEWYEKNKPDYSFEIYELCENNTFKRIQKYYEPMEEGMAFYCWRNTESVEKTKPTIIYKYPNKTREDKVPKEVCEYIAMGTAIDNSLKNCGDITFFIDKAYFVYGEYYNNTYSCGY